MKLPLVLLAAVVSASACTYLPDLQGLDTSGLNLIPTKDYLEIRPTSGPVSQTGFLFIPGALVEPSAYLQPLADFAKGGYVVVIAREAANLAILDPDKGLWVKGQIAGVPRWIVGGHSLGGTMACSLVSKKPQDFDGLVLFAAYPAPANDLSGWSGAVLSLSADKDGLATPAKINAAKPLLPGGTTYQVLAGGCHAYFGAYGPQDGDGTPTVSRAAQHAWINTQLAAFWLSLGAQP